MAVVAHHAFHNGTRVGAAGVDLFFVISGFIMMTTRSSDRTAGEFLADRSWRIYPMWLLAVFPWLLMSSHTPLEVVRSLTLWPVYGSRYLSPALDVGWTLSFELLFYLAFALALGTRAAIPLIIFGICLIVGYRTNSVLFWFLGSPLILEFLLGVAVASIPSRILFGIPVILLGLFWFVFSSSDFYDQAFGQGAMYRVLAWGVPASLLVYGTRSLERYFASNAFEMPVLIGSASYSIYLFHQLILLKFQGIVGFGLSLATGIALYLFLERHVMRARPRWHTAAPATEALIVSSAEEIGATSSG